MRDYWSFPAVMRTFRAVGYGKFQTIDGLEWRTRGGDYVLVSPPQSPFLIPKKANRNRVRSLSFVEGIIGKEIPTKVPGDRFTYEATNKWVPNKKVRYAMSLSRREGAVLTEPTKDEIYQCLEDWVQWKKKSKPHMMVVKGHYREMINDPSFKFIACELDGKIVGASGVTWDGPDGAVCFTKHQQGNWWLSRFLWTISIELLLHMGVRSINCGDTAGKFKKELGLNPIPQYKVDFSKIEQEQSECTIPTETLTTHSTE